MGRVKLKPELAFKRPKKRRNSHPMKRYVHFLTIQVSEILILLSYIQAEIESDSNFLLDHKNFNHFFKPFPSENSPTEEVKPSLLYSVISLENSWRLRRTDHWHNWWLYSRDYVWTWNQTHNRCNSSRKSSLFCTNDRNLSSSIGNCRISTQ